jgi:hypothetical protein
MATTTTTTTRMKVTLIRQAAVQNHRRKSTRRDGNRVLIFVGERPRLLVSDSRVHNKVVSSSGLYPSGCDGDYRIASLTSRSSGCRNGHIYLVVGVLMTSISSSMSSVDRTKFAVLTGMVDASNLCVIV